ncbi:MAG: cob(I)yrinic acid a,c-diamide adenosyltransferase [Oleibacter sp.]|nr:cob(I)yrinic acid a,c-diamide adenosyltransferase [Thalassolituus sp.]
MGNRLSKIVTRTGDTGSTGLGDGSRLRKSDARVDCMGDIDELNSWIGMLRAALATDDEIQTVLSQIQHDLFDLGGELAMPGYTALNDDMVLQLDDALEDLNADLPPIKEFILPGGNEAAARCHMARTVARRAERTYVALLDRETSATEDKANPLGLQYLNRLSDLFFVMARSLARRDGGSEVLWQTRRKK